MPIKHRAVVILFSGLVLANASKAHGQFGNSSAVQQANASTLAGTWVLKNITPLDGTPLTPPMRSEIQNTQITIDGDTTGKILTQGMSLYADPGRPTVTCRARSTGDFKTAIISNHTFLRLAPALQFAGPDCGPPYAGTHRTYPALNFMYELSGDTLKTFEFDQSGVLIYTYARAQLISAPARR